METQSSISAANSGSPFRIITISSVLRKVMKTRTGRFFNLFHEINKKKKTVSYVVLREMAMITAAKYC